MQPQDSEGLQLQPKDNKRRPRRRTVLWVSVLLCWFAAVVTFLLLNR
jgi:type VI protein secretion system component VasF